ncbi:hypothetical protein INT48_002765 [Thamnidium elegans]|uniref:C2H2-type domain-containing protein n=1 Tax=Thamnidium elegans TaxID=101142 RepID=A0A8H7SMH1_9FUNG|nr:hypothetical protein INT48_002765 [Thamnidium elegans]
MKTIQDQQLATANSMYTMPPSIIYEYPTFMETNTFSAGQMLMNSSQVSLSEASVCSSSMGIRTPDVHPVPDTTSSVAQVPCYGDHSTILIKNRCPQQQQWIPEDPVWPIMNDTIKTLGQQHHHHQPYGNNNREEEPELRRQSMNNMNNLSREQLIQRVVQLEKEKELSRKLSGSISPVIESDQDDFHTCRWSGCDTSTTSLDQLIVHTAYYCQWVSCPRNQKPFLKRHKMQNHMRTHTGERPFECHIEDCEKKFSRPDSLNTHIKTHSNIRPYACTVENCAKAYFHSRSLRKHAKSHESQLTPPPPQQQLPYNRTLKQQKFYPTTNSSAFYGDVKIMENFEQQQQQIFAAGTAYLYPYQQQQQQQQQYVSNEPNYAMMDQRYMY